LYKVLKINNLSLKIKKTLKVLH